jgi:hypothetical protein
LGGSFSKKMKKVAILQSNYIPWKGYFDMINMVDEFILYDNVQFTKNDWRNRNRIKTPDGLTWLSIPVYHHMNQTIRETKVSQKNWNEKHWKTIKQNYSKAKYFKQYSDIFESLYLGIKTENLSEINRIFIEKINEIIGIHTKISWAWEYNISGDRVDRLIDLCKVIGANIYLSGPSAKDYLDESLFKKEGFNVEWMDYSGYTEYNQLSPPPFEHGVTILDLLFNTGDNAKKYMKSF